MFDIGAMELFVVAVLALVVVGPKELPRLLRTAGGLMRRVRELSAEFRQGVEQLAAEADLDADPFRDLKKKEGLRPGMSPEDITDHIMKNREAEEAAEMAKEPIKRKSDGTTKAASKDSSSKAATPEKTGPKKTGVKTAAKKTAGVRKADGDSKP